MSASQLLNRIQIPYFLNFLRSLLKPSKVEIEDGTDYISRLNWMLDEIAKTKDRSLYEKLLRSFLFEAQAPFLNSTLKHSSQKCPDVRRIDDFWPWLRNCGSAVWDCWHREHEHEIDFSKDVVISAPWKIKSHIETFTQIGEGLSNGPWKYDRLNHAANYYAPLNFAIAHNGLHSINLAIINREGVFPCNSYHDLTPILLAYECDGHSYIHVESGEVVGQVDSELWAMIFMTARHMVK